MKVADINRPPENCPNCNGESEWEGTKSPSGKPFASCNFCSFVWIANNKKDGQMKRKAERELPGSAAKILKTLEDNGLGPEELDDAVHAAKSGEASDINNNGLEAQIEYLLATGMTEKEILSSVLERNMLT